MTVGLRRILTSAFVMLLACSEPAPRTAFSLTREFTGIDVPVSAQVVEFRDAYMVNGEAMPEGWFVARFRLPDSTAERLHASFRSRPFIDVQSNDTLARLIRDILPKDTMGIARMTFGGNPDNLQIVLVNRLNRTLVVHRNQISSKF